MGAKEPIALSLLKKCTLSCLLLNSILPIIDLIFSSGKLHHNWGYTKGNFSEGGITKLL